jgi:nitrate/TMAO reductase-like tetraheme cytochrome c subunit
MSKKVAPPKKSPILRIAIIAAIAVVILSISGFAFAATQEQNDSFCASCHTQPETTFYERSTAAAATDLASFHKTKTTACIDCHSGSGLGGRLTAEVLGARNAVAWFTGTAVQPAPLNFPISNDNCLKCHATVLSGSSTNIRDRTFGPQGHYHRFLSRWQAASTAAASCVTCHSGHKQGGTAAQMWINTATIGSTCDGCHRALGEGGD